MGGVVSLHQVRRRPKRASDRLLQPGVPSSPLSPPQKKKSELSGQFVGYFDSEVEFFVRVE